MQVLARGQAHPRYFELLDYKVSARFVWRAGVVVWVLGMFAGVFTVMALMPGS